MCVCFFCSQLSGNFLKIAFFKKRVQKLGFSIFCVFKFKFWKILWKIFLSLPKHYRNGGGGVSANFCVFCCCYRRKRQKKMITGISGFGFFCPKMAVSWLKTVFHKMGCWNPYFYSVLGGCAPFGPRCQKREILKSHPKNGKFWLIIEKLFFGIFVTSLFFCPLFSFFCFFLFVFLFCFFVFVLFWRV